jgi:hypothetical protein
MDCSAVCIFESNLPSLQILMSSCSAPATFSPSHCWACSVIMDAGVPLVSPLALLPAKILDCKHKGTFGPEDPHPHKGTIICCVQAMTDDQWVKILTRKRSHYMAKINCITSNTLYWKEMPRQ